MGAATGGSTTTTTTMKRTRRRREVDDVLAELTERTEAVLERYVQSLRAASEEARVRAHLGLLELDERWEAAQAALAGWAGRASAAAVRARGLVDEARVQASLARMEVDEAREAQRRRIEALRAALERAACATADEATATLRRLRERLRLLLITIPD